MRGIASANLSGPVAPTASCRAFRQVAAQSVPIRRLQCQSDTTGGNSAKSTSPARGVRFSLLHGRQAFHGAAENPAAEAPRGSPGQEVGVDPIGTIRPGIRNLRPRKRFDLPSSGKDFTGNLCGELEVRFHDVNHHLSIGRRGVVADLKADVPASQRRLDGPGRGVIVGLRE